MGTPAWSQTAFAASSRTGPDAVLESADDGQQVFPGLLLDAAPEPFRAQGGRQRLPIGVVEAEQPAPAV